MRNLVKRVVEPVLADLAWGARSSSFRDGTLVLAYHNVRPQGAPLAGEYALHMPWDGFLAHLDLLCELATVVPLAETLRPDPQQQGLRVAITFDDAYAGAVELALPELARRGMPATLFVAPGLLDGKSFWWDQMADGIGGALSISARQHALDVLRGRQDDISSWCGKCRVPWATSMPAWATSAQTTAVIQAARLKGISFGSHSWSHPNLAKANLSELKHEMSTPRVWFSNNALSGGEWFAYPYGLANDQTVVAAASAGYGNGFLVTGGFLPPAPTGWLLPRMNVPAGLSPQGLKLRLAGWLAK